MLLPWAVIAIPLALLAARPLNLLQLGDEVAEGLGLRVMRMRMLLALLSAALVAAVVAVAGPIAFVALIAPHMARRVAGHARRAPGVAHRRADRGQPEAHTHHTQPQPLGHLIA